MFTADHSHLDYLHVIDFILLSIYNQSMSTASESQLFDSVARALVPGWPGFNSQPWLTYNVINNKQ